MPETTRELTLDWLKLPIRPWIVLHPITSEELGTPIGRSSGTGQQMLVIAMGKMGAYELNISSDIDLIFAYPEKGETRRGTSPRGKSVSNQEFLYPPGTEADCRPRSTDRRWLCFPRGYAPAPLRSERRSGAEL